LIGGKKRPEASTKLSGASSPRHKIVQDQKEQAMNAIEWKSLTDEEIQKALGVTAESSNWNLIMVLEWAKKIEAALLEKNK
jgi:hypothetical protein